MQLVRRIRGIVGTSAVWAALFAVAGLVGLIPLSLLGARPPADPAQVTRFLANTLMRWTIGGAAIGLVFATTVASVERRRSLNSLSPRRFAAWGFIAGAAVPLSITTVANLTGQSSPANDLRAGIVFGGICGILGAALAAASVRAARRAGAVSEDEGE